MIIVFLIIKILINFLMNLLMVKIIKVYNPEYFICFENMYYFVYYSIDIISNILSGSSRYESIYNFLTEIFILLGSLAFIWKKCILQIYIKGGLKIVIFDK